ARGSHECRRVAARERSGRQARLAPAPGAAERHPFSGEAALEAWVEPAPAASAETAGSPWTGTVQRVSVAPSPSAAVPSPSAEAPPAAVETARRERER